jgi:hypothetical protein
MSIVNQIRRYLHGFMFIALAVVIISALTHLINAIPERTLAIGEKEVITTNVTETTEQTELFNYFCSDSTSCIYYGKYIPTTCEYTIWDYTQADYPGATYWIKLYDSSGNLVNEYTHDGGVVLTIYETGVYADFIIYQFDRLIVYCVVKTTVTETITTTEPAVLVSNKTLLSFISFALTIVIVISGIRKFLPQF